MKFNSIRHKLVFVSSLFIAFIITVLALGTYSYFRQVTRQLISEHQFTLVSSIAEELDISLVTANTALIGSAAAHPPEVLREPEEAQKWLNDRHGIKRVFDSGLFLFTPDGKLMVLN